VVIQLIKLLPTIRQILKRNVLVTSYYICCWHNSTWRFFAVIDICLSIMLCWLSLHSTFRLSSFKQRSSQQEQHLMSVLPF